MRRKIKNGRADLAYRLIKENFHKKEILNRAGYMLSDVKEIVSKWAEYLEELYKGADLEHSEKEGDEIKANDKISRKVFDIAIREFKKVKHPQ